MVPYQVSLHDEAVTLTKAPRHFNKSIGTLYFHLISVLGEKDRQSWPPLNENRISRLQQFPWNLSNRRNRIGGPTSRSVGQERRNIALELEPFRSPWLSSFTIADTVQRSVQGLGQSPAIVDYPI
jgi:hypothetical protein